MSMTIYGGSDTEKLFEAMAQEIRAFAEQNLDWRRKTIRSIDYVLRFPNGIMRGFMEEYHKEVMQYAVWKLQHCPKMAGNFTACITWFNEVVRRNPKERGEYDYLLKILVARQLLKSLTGLRLSQLRTKLCEMINNCQFNWHQPQ